MSELLLGISQSFERIDYEAQLVFVHDDQVESMHLIHSQKDGTQLEQLTYLSGMQREILRFDDTLVCQFDGEDPFIAGKAKKSAFSSNPLVDKINRLEESYTYRVLGKDRVANRSTFVIDMTAMDESLYGYRFWIDKDSGLVLRADVLSGNDIIEQVVVVSLSIKSDLSLDNFNPKLIAVANSANDQPQPKNLGKKPPSQSLEQFESPWQVSWLPKGFTFKSGRQQVRGGEYPTKLYHYLFSNGVTAISVYLLETPQQHNKQQAAKVVKKGSVTIYDIAQNDYRVTVVGEIPKLTAKKIAMSVSAK
ncbi:MAG: MucB/RseB C-terminal domain-containing protein [Pseudomonadota bacterium]